MESTRKALRSRRTESVTFTILFYSKRAGEEWMKSERFYYLLFASRKRASLLSRSRQAFFISSIFLRSSFPSL